MHNDECGCEIANTYLERLFVELSHYRKHFYSVMMTILLYYSGIHIHLIAVDLSRTLGVDMQIIVYGVFFICFLPCSIGLIRIFQTNRRYVKIVTDINELTRFRGYSYIKLISSKKDKVRGHHMVSLIMILSYALICMDSMLLLRVNYKLLPWTFFSISFALLIIIYTYMRRKEKKHIYK